MLNKLNTTTKLHNLQNNQICAAHQLEIMIMIKLTEKFTKILLKKKEKALTLKVMNKDDHPIKENH